MTFINEQSLIFLHCQCQKFNIVNKLQQIMFFLQQILYHSRDDLNISLM